MTRIIQGYFGHGAAGRGALYRLVHARERQSMQPLNETPLSATFGPKDNGPDKVHWRIYPEHRSPLVSDAPGQLSIKVVAKFVQL